MKTGLVSWSALLIAGVSADIVYVTDLTIYTLLAPCAKSAVRYGVLDRTIRSCPAPVTELQSCICTKNDNRLAVSSFIASGVSHSCGETASEDQQSAQVVLSAYCDQVAGDDGAEATPTQGFEQGEHLVEDYATDIQAYSDLAPCARSAIDNALIDPTRNLCPSAPSLLAPCLCGKNQNSLRASQTINTSISFKCDDNPDDRSSAQEFFAAYCAMTDGTTSFPTPSSPPGDMTYSITALPEYSALAACAKSALNSGLFKPKESYCPEGPQAFASCACIKNGVSKGITSVVSGEGKRRCGDVETDNVSSALSVFGYYCSAARGEVVASGVTESLGGTNSSPTNDPGDPESSSSGGRKSRASTGTIIGGVIAGLAVLGAIVAGVFYMRKRRRDQIRTAAAAAAAVSVGGGNPYGQPPPGPGPGMGMGMGEKPELLGTQLAGVMPAPSPLSEGTTLAAKDGGISPAQTASVSPGPVMPEFQGQRGMPPELLGGQVHTQAELQGGQALPVGAELQGGQAQRAMPAELLSGQAHTQAELQGGQMHQVGAELQGQQYHPQELHGQQQYAQELHGQVQHPQELHGQQQGYGYPAPQQGAYGPPGAVPQQPQAGYVAPVGQPGQAGQPGWQAGPVQGYYEMPTPFQQQPQQ